MKKTVRLTTNQRLVVFGANGEERTIADMNPINRHLAKAEATVEVGSHETAFIVDFNGEGVMAIPVNELSQEPLDERHFAYLGVMDGYSGWFPVLTVGELYRCRACGYQILKFPKVVPQANGTEMKPLFVGAPDRGYYTRDRVVIPRLMREEDYEFEADFSPFRGTNIGKLTIGKEVL